MEIKIEGLDRVLNELRKTGKSAVLAAEKGRKNLAGFIQRQAKSLASVDEGQLRNSIEVKNDKNVSIVRTNVQHAIPNEFGTGKLGDPEVPHTSKDHWTYKKGDRFYTTHGMEPRPFMRPAAKFGEKAAPEIFKEAFEEENKQ